MNLSHYLNYKYFKDKLKSRFGEERAGKALEWFSNHILTSHTFSLRPKIINKLHFNEWTNSNAEAEHSALKSKGVDLRANGSLADVATKSISAGERRMGRKIKRQADLRGKDGYQQSNETGSADAGKNGCYARRGRQSRSDW